MKIHIDGAVGGRPIAIGYSDKCSYMSVKGEPYVVSFYWRKGRKVLRTVTSKRIIAAFAEFWENHDKQPDPKY